MAPVPCHVMRCWGVGFEIASFFLELAYNIFRYIFILYANFYTNSDITALPQVDAKFEEYFYKERFLLKRIAGFM